MRSKRTIMVEKEVTTYKCDFCSKSVESNTGCCGVRPIMTCYFCSSDMCYDHREWYSEDDWSDYPHGFYACPNCNGQAFKAWELAKEFAGRYDDIVDVTNEWFNNPELERTYEELQ